MKVYTQVDISIWSNKVLRRDKKLISLPQEESLAYEEKSRKVVNRVIQEAIHHLPASQTKKAQNIRRKLTESDQRAHLVYDEHRQFICQGVAVRGSDLVDLIENILAPRKFLFKIDSRAGEPFWKKWPTITSHSLPWLTVMPDKKFKS